MRSIVRNFLVLIPALAFSSGIFVSGSPQAKPGAKAVNSQALPAPAPKADASVPFRVGEVLTYDVSWSRTVSAGTATLSVKDKLSLAGGQTAYDIVAEAKPGFVIRTVYPIYYKLESYLETRSLLPIRATMYSVEKTRKRTKTTKFIGPTSIEYEYATASVSRSTKPIERMTRDPLSLFYVIRGMSLVPGQQLTIPFVESGTMYKLTVKVGGYEKITTKAGTYRAIRLTPTFSDASGKPVTDRKLSLWISDDPRHLPIRFESTLLVGSFVLNLIHVDG
jgi:hypothetical protein